MAQVFAAELCRMAATAPERRPPTAIATSMSLLGVPALTVRAEAHPYPRPARSTRNLLNSPGSTTVPSHRRTPKFAAGLPIQPVTIGAGLKADEPGLP